MGLYDRDYMHRHHNSNGAMSGRQMLWALIIINIAAFLILDKDMRYFFCLTISPQSTGFQLNYIWEIFTASFMHFGFSHIFFNMWGLYIFGSLLANYLNGTRMLLLYLLGAAFGNIIFVMFSAAPLTRPLYLAGASGAVCAFMTAVAVLEPNRRFALIFMPFTPIKTTTLVICYTILEMLSGIFSRGTGIAHLAHLGGFIGGYIIMRCFFGNRLQWDPLRQLFHSNPTSAPRRPRSSDNFARPTASGNSTSATPEKVTQRELNYLLDKLSEHGINSLNEHELARLRQARKQMRGEE